MRLPKEILVGPHLYRIRMAKRDEIHLAHAGALGQCEASSTTIYVNPHMSDSQTADTLLHELLHAAFDQTSMRQGNMGNEEEVVSALAPILLTMLRANPELVEVLIGRA